MQGVRAAERAAVQGLRVTAGQAEQCSHPWGQEQGSRACPATLIRAGFRPAVARQAHKGKAALSGYELQCLGEGAGDRSMLRHVHSTARTKGWVWQCLSPRPRSLQRVTLPKLSGSQISHSLFHCTSPQVTAARSRPAPGHRQPIPW